MSEEELLRIPILAQGKSPILLIGLFVGAVFGGAILAGIAQALGVPERISFVIPMLLILSSVGFVIWSSVASQGTIRVSGDRLIIESRLGNPVDLMIGASQGSLVVWKQTREALAATTAGVLLRIEHSGGSVEIGTWQPELARGIQEEKVMLLPPSFIVKPEDFLALIERFGVSLSGARR
jgi:hypothetical protein